MRGLDDNSSFEGLQCDVHGLYAPTEENPCIGLLQESQHPQIPRMMRQTREKTTNSFTYIKKKKKKLNPRSVELFLTPFQDVDQLHVCAPPPKKKKNQTLATALAIITHYSNMTGAPFSSTNAPFTS